MEATLENPQVTIRSAPPHEVAMMLSFITRKAQCDRDMGSFTGTLQSSAEKIRHPLFGPHPFAYLLLAARERQPVGFALYYCRYSSFVGQPSLWLDDLYVDADKRSQGAGVALMRV